MTLKTAVSKAREAATRWEKRQERRCLVRWCLVRSALAQDRDENGLQRFADDIKDALQTLKVGDCFPSPLSALY